MAAETGSELNAWLASACMPAGMLAGLLDQYENAAGCFQALSGQDPAFRELVSPRFCSILKEDSRDSMLNFWRKSMNRHDIRSLLLNECGYPESLKRIPDPPPILFYRGNIECLGNRCLSMVGSRSASYAGQQATQRLAKELSKRGVTIVSGLASGIDTCAHRGCLDGGSPTVAVLGCGLDRIYPADNLKLRDEILAGRGLLLSEYAPGERPTGWHFPVRNRIITGICSALILMEAKIRSGSMTSVQHALEQGKDVFVYPGDPSSAYFDGNHRLLREGGIYFTSAEDILEDLHWLDNTAIVRHNSDCSAGQQASTPEQSAVIKALQPGNLSFEQLLAYTKMKPSELMSTLTILQIQGQIEPLPGKQYHLK